MIRFYGYVNGDPLLAPFFEGVDLQAQIAKQVAFMTMAFAGPSRYTGRDLKEAHAPLVSRGLGDRHFDAILTHLERTLREMNVDAVTVLEVLSIVETTRADVLGRR